MVPVRSFMAVIFWDVKIIHFPGALVVGQVSPLHQVMHIPIRIITAGKNKHKEKQRGLLEGFVYQSIIKLFLRTFVDMATNMGHDKYDI